MISFKRKKKDIPAKLFFDIIGTQDMTKLIIEGEPKEKDLVDAWDDIFDLYFTEKDDMKLKLILRKQANILRFDLLVTKAKMYMELVFSNAFKNSELDEILEELKELGLRINSSKNVTSQVLRILKQKIPSWEIRIEREKLDLIQLTKGKKAKFYDALASLTKVGGVALNQDITLGFYIAYEKQLSTK